MKSSTMAGGASDINPRHHSDFYESTDEMIVALFKHLPHWRKLPIWEPACGDGAIVRTLGYMGVPVAGYGDIRPTKICLGGQDFLRAWQPPSGTGAIVTNPPFYAAADFIRHARGFNIPFAMVLKSSFWHVEANRALFVETGPVKVLPFGWRPAMAPERGDNPTMEFAWTVWDAEWSNDCRYYPLVRPK